MRSYPNRITNLVPSLIPVGFHYAVDIVPAKAVALGRVARTHPRPVALPYDLYADGGDPAALCGGPHVACAVETTCRVKVVAAKAAAARHPSCRRRRRQC